jgi:hypothetical protein
MYTFSIIMRTLYRLKSFHRRGQRFLDTDVSITEIWDTYFWTEVEYKVGHTKQERQLVF